MFFAQFGRTASTTLFGGWNRAKYHSMQVQLTRPLRNGLLLRGAYTLGETLNLTDEDGTAGFDYNAPEVFERNWAHAGFDRRHTFTLAYTYRLPFGSDSGNTMLNLLIKDWQVNGTYAAYSGTPFSVTASNTALDQRGNLQTADLVGEVRRVGDRPRRAVLRSGGMGEHHDGPLRQQRAEPVLRPRVLELQHVAVPDVPDQGRMRLQFRAEAFSVTNHPQWSNPNGSVTSSNFMRITSTRGGARNARVGLRLEFEGFGGSGVRGEGNPPSPFFCCLFSCFGWRDPIPPGRPCWPASSWPRSGSTGSEVSKAPDRTQKEPISMKARLIGLLSLALVVTTALMAQGRGDGQRAGGPEGQRGAAPPRPKRAVIVTGENSFNGHV